MVQDFMQRGWEKYEDHTFILQWAGSGAGKFLVLYTNFLFLVYDPAPRIFFELHLFSFLWSIDTFILTSSNVFIFVLSYKRRYLILI